MGRRGRQRAENSDVGRAEPLGTRDLVDGLGFRHEGSIGRAREAKVGALVYAYFNVLAVIRLIDPSADRRVVMVSFVSFQSIPH